MKRHEPVRLQYYMALLHRGAGWNSDKSDQTRRIEMTHARYLDSLADTGKLAIAGRCIDDGVLRGVFVFKVGSLDEARALSNANPVVKAGRLVVDVHPSELPEGALP